MQRWFGNVQDANGRAVANATVTVYTSGVINPLPVIYVTSGSKTAPAAQANPMLSDALGNYGFAAPDGTYDIVITGGGIPTKTLPFIDFFDGGVTYPSPMLGTVTSVGFSIDRIFTVTNSPVTGAATLVLTADAVAANTFFRGPTTGANAVPSFGVLVDADLPTAGTAGAKGSATQVPVFTTDAYGRVVSSTNTTITPTFANVASKPTTVAGYGITDAAALGTANAWTKAQNVAASALSGTAVTPDSTLSNVFYLPLTGNTTLSNPTGLVSGATMTIIMKQGGVGGYTLTYGTKYKFPGGVVQQPDDTLAAVSALYMQYDATNDILLCNYGKKYS